MNSIGDPERILKQGPHKKHQDRWLHRWIVLNLPDSPNALHKLSQSPENYRKYPNSFYRAKYNTDKPDKDNKERKLQISTTHEYQCKNIKLNTKQDPTPQ